MIVSSGSESRPRGDWCEGPTNAQQRPQHIDQTAGQREQGPACG
jgi:hypothetical protein